MNPKKDQPKEIPTWTHHELLRKKERTVEAARGRWSLAWRQQCLMTADVSPETVASRRKGHGISKAVKENTCQPRILFSEKILISSEAEKKILGDKN